MNIFEIAGGKFVSRFAIHGVRVVDPKMPFRVFVEPTDANEPTEKADAAEPMDPSERAEPTEPRRESGRARIRHSVEKRPVHAGWSGSRGAKEATRYPVPWG